MSKYIDAEKLIAEIKRRKKELFEIGGDTFENKWACGSLDNIKAFVISLQQEQPEVDLEKEIHDVLITPNATCGTSTATLHGNTSATDGKEHNPSFTD